VDASVEDRVLGFFDELVDWSDPEQALDTAGTGLARLSADRHALRRLVEGLSMEHLDPSLGGSGAYWFWIAGRADRNLSIWLRFCPTGAVVPAHTHASPVLAVVVTGSLKQTLIGHGGGVQSPEGESTLFVRHELPGQVFALNARQRHETSSTAGSLLLVATPADAGAAPPSEGFDDETTQKGERALSRLARALKALEAEDPAP